MSEEKLIVNIDQKQDQQIGVQGAQHLWDWWRLEEANFNDRLQFFLVFESVLLGGLVLFLGQNNPLNSVQLALKLFIIAGFLLTIVWTYIQCRQRYVMDVIRDQVRKYLPEFAQVEKEIEKKRWPFRIRDVLSYVVPGIFLLLWMLLFFVL